MSKTPQLYSPLQNETPEAEAVAVATVGVPHVKAESQQVEVVAPADLSGGYHLSVDVNGRTAIVAVVSSYMLYMHQ
jgi:hypothetical protein